MELAVVDSFSCRTRGLRKHMVKIVEHWGLSCLTKKHLGGDRRLVTASGDRMWLGVSRIEMQGSQGDLGIVSRYATMKGVAIDRWPELQFFGR